MTNEFTLYGVMDKSTGKLVSNLTNPRHKYWETRKTAENAVRKFMSRRYNADRQLEVVEIQCKIKVMNEVNYGKDC
jgi:hypothetical protein